MGSVLRKLSDLLAADGPHSFVPSWEKAFGRQKFDKIVNSQ